MDPIRGDGRNRSEIPDLDARIQALDEDLNTDGLIGTELSDESDLVARALLYTVESYAAALFQRLKAQLFSARLGMPKSDAEVFSILQASGVFDLVEARKLRQFCEARTLSGRDLSKIDLAGIREMVADREWIRELFRKLPV